MNEKVFRVDKPVIGMIHLNGLMPKKVHDLAKFEIEQMYTNGVDAVLVENYFGTAEDVAWTLDYLHTQYNGNVYGVNILGGTEIAFSLAAEYKAAFIQIDSVCGHLTPAKDETFAEKLSELRSGYPVFLLGGVRFKYQPLRSGRSLEEDLTIGKERCDAIVVTGSGTGKNTELEKILQFRKILGEFPLFVGAGMTEDNCREQISIADGAIVGTWFKQEGYTESQVDPDRIKRFMSIVKEVRNSMYN